MSSKSWIPWLFQRISLVWARDGYTKHFTSEILLKSLGIHDLEHGFGAMCASMKWNLYSVRVKIHYYLYFHCNVWFIYRQFKIPKKILRKAYPNYLLAILEQSVRWSAKLNPRCRSTLMCIFEMPMSTWIELRNKSIFKIVTQKYALLVFFFICVSININ